MRNYSFYSSLEKMKRQSGFSVVELMVAGFLGLVLIGGVIQLFISSNQAYRTQDDLATIQEDGRLALMFLKQQIQMAGYISSLDVDPIPSPVTFGNLASRDDTTDVLTISYEGDIDTVTGLVYDCNGVGVAGRVITSTFYIDDKQLLCQGNGVGSVAQPLIDGVADFQVMYGVEEFVAGVLPNCRSGRISRYLNATQVVAQNLQERILSVRIALLLESSNEVLPEVKSINFNVLDKEVSTDDKLARRIFQQTIFMPNAVFVSVSNPEALNTCQIQFELPTP
ncbi:PilW family protein [Aliikangiella maris]|uniref:PilW family protein n=2 Tax=Aliikangiella maris TaxID=3162458 RepID=A0ABV2BNU4_9GAMM